MARDMSFLPEPLRAQAVIVAGEAAWPPTAAPAVIKLLRERGLAVVGVELWVAEGESPRVLGWSLYKVPYGGDWDAYVEANAAEALAELSTEAPTEALYNLTWVERGEV